jgi:hypothetical protein
VEPLPLPAVCCANASSLLPLRSRASCRGGQPRPTPHTTPRPHNPRNSYGLGRFTTESEVDAAIAQTVSHVTKLREMSPLWEMVQEGIDLKTIQWSQH